MYLVASMLVFWISLQENIHPFELRGFFFFKTQIQHLQNRISPNRHPNNVVQMV